MDKSSPPLRETFDRFLKTPEIEMLSAALPYVSGQMRKSLAVYIKSTEMQRILSDFDNEEVLSACGFEPSPPDPEAMLKAMKLAGGPNPNPQIDQMLQMMQLLKTYQKLNEIMQQNPEMITFLNNIMNQTPPNHSSNKPNLKSAEQDLASSSSSFSQTADLLKQFTGTDNSDMMTLLSQMLKNSR